MNTQQAKLYQRIQAFCLDEPDVNLPLSKRLARDNGWTREYTQRVSYRVRLSAQKATDSIRDRLQNYGLLVSEHQAKLVGQLPAFVIFMAVPIY
ncbi:MAG TPA: hypothetical protein DD379_04595 [Cyanobacteria bacterium UBA11162]|nr:hypothetical protein [Cyanobacteria bacterium UBA11162]